MTVDVPTLAVSGRSRSSVTGAIREAAQVTGASFDYLLATAKVESDLNPTLTVRSSSATGLFQFIEQTWLATLKQGGSALGYGNYADAISRTPSGRYVVKDPALRDDIMRLRKDATANARMAGVFTQQNAAQLARRIGRAPSEGELYLAHFFGPHSAAKAIRLAGSDPTADAVAVFPAAAAANTPIFYDKQGNARSIAGVCAELMRRYQVARAQAPAPAFGVAAATKPTSARPPALIPMAATSEPRIAPPRSASAALSEPVPAAMAFAGETVSVIGSDAAAAPPARGHETGSLFHSLYQDDARRAAVSPVVAELWGGRPAPTRDAARPLAPASGNAPRGHSAHDLFRDMHPKVRARFDRKA